MTKFNVPVRVEVPAHGIVEVEATSFSEACMKLQADIDENGFLSRAGEVDFTACWEDMANLSLDKANFPEGRRD